MPRYERDDRVWTILHQGNRLVITEDRKTSVRNFLTPALAATQLVKLCEQRAADGWHPLPDDARHPELEAVIARDPDDAAHYAILGDWLEGQGDPRGRMIALALAAAAPRAADGVKLAARKYFAEYADQLLGPIVDPTHEDDAEPAFAWRFGFIHNAHLEASRGRDVVTTLEPLLRAPAGRFLVGLSLESGAPLGPAIALLAASAPASLRRLRIAGRGELELSALWSRVPHLRRLTLRGHGIALGELDVAELEHLDVFDDKMRHATARQLATRPWPALQRLRLDFGSGHLTGDASIDDVLELLTRADLPRLAHVAIIHTRYAREVIRDLAAGPLAAQLEVLELSDDLIDDALARELVQLRARFPKLTHLDLTGNPLELETVTQLRALGLTVYKHR